MNGGRKKLRVAIIVSHPIQHFVHLYKVLAKSGELDLKVIFCSKIGVNAYFDKNMNTEIQWATDLLGGYEHEFLPEADSIKESGFMKVNNPSIVAALKTFDPDVVQLHGYAQLTLLRALIWSKFKRIPVLLWSDSSLLFKRAQWKQFLKDRLLPSLLSQFHSVLSTGDNNAAYYLRYGVKSENIFRCPFTVDETLLSHANIEKTKFRTQLRAKYGIEEDEKVLLFVGKLAPWKRPQDILDALPVAQLKLDSTIKLVAFFAGDGVMRDTLEAQAKIQNLRAIFAGFINVDVLPSIYAMADVLVFPSEREPYGLSAREAICVGLPLIVSDQIGCIGTTDAARSGHNAIVYKSMHIDLLAEAMIALVGDSKLRRTMAEASLSVAAEMGANKSVAGFLAAVNAASRK
jgi:glycosyltransferase involved in cell wall biosynthesis